MTSLERMSGETGLSVQQVRTAISKLEKTGEITNRSFNKYRIIRRILQDSEQIPKRALADAWGTVISTSDS